MPVHPEGELYGKTVSAIDPTDLVVLRTQFFDPAGKPLKTWTVEKLERVDGFWTVLSQQMQSLPDDHWSRLALGEVHYNAALPGDVFSRSYLKR